ncbi:ribosomal protein L7/L12 [Paenibacillus sp. QZ-Y1]|uniref:ribosomal protein L7/L12 n=1 Tax=Paenibacillus sp. QZ-Y1 TaxID=3414511 RepID=UPI003F7A99F7
MSSIESEALNSMEINTIVFIVFLLLILILLVRVISLQSQLNELKQDVERLEIGGGPVSHSSLNYSPTSLDVSPHSASQAELTELDRELLALVQQGKKIVAIKKVREAKNLSLKDAKDYVESFERL